MGIVTQLASSARIARRMAARAVAGEHARDGGGSGTVRRTALPPTARELSGLARFDYADAFRADATGAGDLTAQEWARAMIEGAPRATREGLRRAWSGLGLELGPPGGEATVLGWEVRRAERDHALLAARSRLGFRAELLFVRDGSAVLFCTLVQHTGALGRVIWAGLPLVHQPTVVELLELAVRRERARAGG